MDRLALDAAHAVPFALVLVVADQRTDHRQRVVVEQDLRGLHHSVLFKEPDDLRNIGVNRTSLVAAHRIFTLQTTVCFVDDMYWHLNPPLTLKNGDTILIM